MKRRPRPQGRWLVVSVALLVTYRWLAARLEGLDAVMVVAVAVAGLVALATVVLVGRAIFARRVVIEDWRDAEVAAARWLKSQGLRRVALTPPGADAGIDIVARDLVAQVKHSRYPVGRPVVQQLVGAAGETRSALFSTSGFSAPAHQYADDHGVALVHLHLDGRARHLNSATTGRLWA